MFLLIHNCRYCYNYEKFQAQRYEVLEQILSALSAVPELLLAANQSIADILELKHVDRKNTKPRLALDRQASDRKHQGMPFQSKFIVKELIEHCIYCYLDSLGNDQGRKPANEVQLLPFSSIVHCSQAMVRHFLTILAHLAFGLVISTFQQLQFAQLEQLSELLVVVAVAILMVIEQQCLFAFALVVT